jgi:ATP-dependent RNA helicase DDX1
LAEIEEHLGCTIQQIENDLKVPQNEFDGKVVYGEKRKNAGSGYQDHVKQLVPIVDELAELEHSAQSVFIRRLLL